MAPRLLFLQQAIEVRMGLLWLAILTPLALVQEPRGTEEYRIETSLFPGTLAVRDWSREDSLRESAAPWDQDPPPSRPPLEAPPLQAEEPPSVHSCSSFDAHFSCDNWYEFVWKDYLTETPVLLPLGLFAAAAIVSRFDRKIEPRMEGILGKGSTIGDVTQWTLGVAAFAAAVFSSSPGRSSEDQFWSTTESFLATTAAVWILKGAVDRHRPSTEGPDGTFPSGHTATAFWAASVIDSSLGHEWGIPAYAVAVLTGVSRLSAHQHWASDVVAGAAIGVLFAGMFDALHFGTGRGGHGLCGVPLDVRVGESGDRSFSVGMTVSF